MPRKRAFKLTPPDPSEDQLQASIAGLLERILPEDRVAFTHFPSGGYLLSAAARARLYRLGLRQGWPDLLICYSLGRVLWLEVKTPTGVVSPAQRKMHLRLRALSQPVVIVRRIEDVIAALIEYHVPFLKVRLAESYHGTAASYQSTTPGSATQLTEGASP